MADEYSKLDIPDTRSAGERLQDAGGAILDAIAASGGNPRALAAGIIGGGLRAGIGTDSYLAERQRMANAYAQNRLSQMDAEDNIANFNDISNLRKQDRSVKSKELESKAQDIDDWNNGRVQRNAVTNARAQSTLNDINRKEAIRPETEAQADRRRKLEAKVLAQQKNNFSTQVMTDGMNRLTKIYNSHYGQSQEDMTNFVQQTSYFTRLTPAQRERLLNSQAFKQMATVDALFKTASDMRSGIDTGTEDGRKLISEFAKTLGGEVSFSGGVPVLEYNGQSFPLNDPRVLQAVRQEALNQFKAEADSQLTLNRMLNSPDVTESTIGTVCSKYADLYGVSAGQALARVKDIMVNGLDGKGRPVEDQAYFMLNRMAQHLNESMKKGMKINPANYEQAGQLLQMIGYRVDNPEAATAAEWRFSKIDEPTTLPLTLEQMTQMVSINDRISREIATDYMKMRESAEKAQAEWRKGEQDRIAKEEKDQEKRDIEMLSNMYGEKFIPLTPKDQDTMRAVWNNSVKLAQKRGIFDKNGDPVPVTKGNIERFKETDRDWKKMIERIGLNPDDFYSPVENVLLVYELKELEAELDKLPYTVNDKSVPAIGAVGGVYPGRGEIRNPKRVQKQERAKEIEKILEKRGVKRRDRKTYYGQQNEGHW